MDSRVLTRCCLDILETIARDVEATVIVAKPINATEPTDAPSAVNSGLGMSYFRC